jgi:hypothetical protein
MLDVLRSKLKMVTKLYIIGYSFGDEHIDEIIVAWLVENRNNSIVIVDPFRNDPPDKYARLNTQVQIIKSTTSTFFMQYRSDPMTYVELIGHWLRNVARPHIERKAANKWPRGDQGP